LAQVLQENTCEGTCSAHDCFFKIFSVHHSSTVTSFYTMKCEDTDSTVN